MLHFQSSAFLAVGTHSDLGCWYHAVKACPRIVIPNLSFLTPEGDVTPTTMSKYLSPWIEVVSMGGSTNLHFEMSTVVWTLPAAAPSHLVVPNPEDPAHVIKHGSGLVGSFPKRSVIITTWLREDEITNSKDKTSRAILRSARVVVGALTWRSLYVVSWRLWKSFRKRAR